mmetsp:Transcript_25/g.73  ORF Transcript_25/g.73 Transcript_25/m.73 type:complete len:504 (-) Transcript_25:242-1753(-)
MVDGATAATTGRRATQRRPNKVPGTPMPGTFQKAFMYRRKLEASYGIILRQKERLRRVVRFILLLGSVTMIACIITGAVLLEAAESCRFPRFEYTETLSYRIQTDKATLDNIYRSGKLVTLAGGSVKTIFLSQDFGTYTIRADPDPDLTEIVFVVKNRAKDRYFLPRTTQLSAEFVLDVKEISPEYNISKPAFNVFLHSNTSNELYGPRACRRADVTIVVPTACLLDESKLDIRVTKGHIRSEGAGTEQANFDTLTLSNEVGDINAHNLQGYRVNLETSSGTLNAQNISAHYLFMLSKSNGGIIKATNVTLYSGDIKTSCKPVVTTKPGFPTDDPQYQSTNIVCEKEVGKMTVDSRGAENGGFPAIELSRIAGGDVSHKLRLGHTKIRLKACYDFHGTFNISSVFGTKTVVAMSKPLTALEQLLERSQEEDVYITNSNTSDTPPWLEIIKRTPTWTHGQIYCPLGLEGEQPFNLEAFTNVTGNIMLEILEPRLGWNGPASEEN